MYATDDWLKVVFTPHMCGPHNLLELRAMQQGWRMQVRAGLCHRARSAIVRQQHVYLSSVHMHG